MIDIELIKKRYEQMPDEKLVVVLKLDGVEITYEAFIILKREYNRRKLNPELLTEIENKRIENSKQKVYSNLEKEATIIENRLWSGVLKLKSENKTNKEIFDWLVNEGIQPESAIECLNYIEPVAVAVYKRAKRAMIFSFLFFFGGIIFCIANLQQSVNLTFAIYGIILAVAPLRFIHTNHKTYKLCEKIHYIISKEKEEAEKAQ